LGNTLATVAALGVLIVLFDPLSGAQFNPVVSLVLALRGEQGWRVAAAYVPAQVVAMIAGAWLAHAMFGLPLMQSATQARGTPGEALGEFVATFWLLLTILGTLATRPVAVVLTVPAAIAAGYWFTSSTSFANPAITIARSFTDSFSGVRPADLANFIAAQLLGGVAALAVARLLWRAR
jgi:glycerol uptake facilitator-like aquaporin